MKLSRENPQNPDEPFFLVEVVWTDAVSDNDWMSLSQSRNQEPVTVITCGYLIREDATCISVATNARDDMASMFGITTIPAGWVQKITYMHKVEASND